MFSDYFIEYSKSLKLSLEKNRSEAEVSSKTRGKGLKAYNDFFRFLKDHIPETYVLANGKVRNKQHILNKSCDLLIYNKYTPKILDMAGGYILADLVYGFMSLDYSLNQAAMESHSTLTGALKTLYRMDKPIADNEPVPLYSIHFIYNNELSLADYRDYIRKNSSARGMPINAELDLAVVLDQGIMIKNWEDRGRYLILETGPDTLQWFYILLMEFLDRDGANPIDFREMIRTPKRYQEY